MYFSIVKKCFVGCGLHMCSKILLFPIFLCRRSLERNILNINRTHLKSLKPHFAAAPFRNIYRENKHSVAREREEKPNDSYQEKRRAGGMERPVSIPSFCRGLWMGKNRLKPPREKQTDRPSNNERNAKVGKKIWQQR